MNLHAYQTHFTHESRMLKETRGLAEGGFFNQVCIGAIWKPGLKVAERLDAHRTVWRAPLWSTQLPDSLFGKLVKYSEWELRLFLKYWKEEVEVFNAHSLIALPLGVLFKACKKCKLVYDTHELETEIQMGNIQRVVFKFLERLLIPYADIVVTVSESIAAWYRNEYNLVKVFVIKNIPLRPVKEAVRSRVLRDYFQIRDDDVLFIYQGVLEEGRGIELILECFLEANRNRHIVFMGMGSLQEKIKQCADRYANIHFHAAVSPAEVIHYTASADVGIHIIENTCLNHYYCLPNKVFEYLFSGLPAIVSDFPEMSRIVKEEQCGWAIPVEKQALLGLINNLSREEIAEKKKRARRCSAKFDWQDEEEKLLEIYRGFLQLSWSGRRPDSGIRDGGRAADRRREVKR